MPKPIYKQKKSKTKFNHSIVGICHTCKKEVGRSSFITLNTPLKKISGEPIIYLIHKRWGCLLPVIDFIHKEIEFEFKRYEEVIQMLENGNTRAD